MLQNEIAARLVKIFKTSPDGYSYAGSIDVLHDVVHQGKMHTCSITTLNVADNSFLRARIVASADKDVHARLSWTSEGKSRLKTYIGTTYSNNGTIYTPFNRQTKLAESLDCVVYVNPTINVAGTIRGDDFVGSGGSTPNRLGGTGAGDIETVINAGTELLIEVQNVRGSASDLNFIFNLYERDKF